MSNLEDLQKRFQGITLNNSGSLNKRRTKKRAINPSDEQLAIQQLTSRVQLTSEEEQVLMRGLGAYAEVVGYYDKRLPLEALSDETVAELYMKHSHRPRQEAVVFILRDYLRNKVEQGLLESTLLSDQQRLTAAIQYLITRELRTPHRL